MGKYGLWIFTDLTPTGPNGVCGETEPKAIRFGGLPDSNENGPVPPNTYGFFAWHCQRGAEFATGGAIQFHNMVVANNWKAGLAGKETFLETYATPEMQDQASVSKKLYGENWRFLYICIRFRRLHFYDKYEFWYYRKCFFTSFWEQSG